MENFKVAIVVISFVVLAILLYYFFNTSSVYSSVQNATTMQMVNSSSLPNNGSNINYAYSIWVYVNDWSTNYGSYKVIFGRNYATGSAAMDGSTNCLPLNTSSGALKASGTFSPAPIVFLDQYENNLGVTIVCNVANTPTVETYVVPNGVPLQRWVHIAVSVYQTVLDIYIDGKLVSTNVLPGLPNIPQTSSTPTSTTTFYPNLYITPCGGFNGWTSKMQYFSTPLNPQQVWDLYSQGYGAGYFSNLFNQTGLTVTVNKNGVPQTSFTI